MGAVLHCGAARNHRTNPVVGLRLEQIYGTPVLMSGLAPLLLSKHELSLVNNHHKETIQNLLRLLPNTPQSVFYFLAGSLPGEALVHLRQFSLFSMIMELEDCILAKHAMNVFSCKRSSGSWLYNLRNPCLHYQLSHPLTLLNGSLLKVSLRLWQISMSLTIGRLNCVRKLLHCYP